MGRRLHLSVRIVLLTTSPIATHDAALASLRSVSASLLQRMAVQCKKGGERSEQPIFVWKISGIFYSYVGACVTSHLVCN